MQTLTPYVPSDLMLMSPDQLRFTMHVSKGPEPDYAFHFIPNYSEMESSLRQVTFAAGLTSSSPVAWTDDAETSFLSLKKALQSAPTLGLPDHNEPLILYAD